MPTLFPIAVLLAQAIMPGTTLGPDYKFTPDNAINPNWYSPETTAVAVAAQTPTTPAPPSVVWAVDSGPLPPGLSLNPNGTLSGTPTTAGTYTVTIRATIAGLGNITRQFTLTIAPAIAIAPTPPPPGWVGVTYTHTFTTVEGAQ